LNATPLVTAGDHVYVSAPLPLRVTEAPTQITELVAEAPTTGNGLTVTETEATFVLVQPVKVFVPVTE
jgi:hypothetical protein